VHEPPPVPIYRGREVTGFAQDDTGVDVELSDGPSLRAEYLVGCDEGRSLVRKAAGFEFPGWDPTTSSLIAEVEMAEEPEWGIRRDALGVHSLIASLSISVVIERRFGPAATAAPFSGTRYNWLLKPAALRGLL
jgi:2-polyprenyl-6-methoxyphenol hydroxylase-like FAD-dependent oxidoreductase